MRKTVLFFIIGLLQIDVACAININTDARAWWGYNGQESYSYGNSGAKEFVIAGGLRKSGPHGTHGDEWAIVAMVAEQIVEHGGLFCPYQIQCANKRKKQKAWTMYYEPVGFTHDKCIWLCESGYTGTNCMKRETDPTYCDKTSMHTRAGGKFTGLSVKTYGGDDGQKENKITGFHQYGREEHDVVLGIVQFLEHGVKAAPVHIGCGRDNWKDVDSFVEVIDLAPGVEKLLCAEGYTAADNGVDCVEINKDVCEVQDLNFCANFDKTKYNSAMHYLETSYRENAGPFHRKLGCTKYFCTEPNTAFTSTTDTTCAPCSTGVKGGTNIENGTCVKCATGEYFDEESNKCQSAHAYSKTEMQYGKGKTRQSNAKLNDQCWTKVVPDEYKECVESGGTQSTATNQN